MEDCSEYSNPLSRKTGASKVRKRTSNKEHCKSAKHGKSHVKKPSQTKNTEKAYYGGESRHERISKATIPPSSIPIEEQVLKKLEKERKLLKKWTTEQSKAKNEYPDADIADESLTANAKISEIEDRYDVLLPAIKLVLETLEQAAFKRSSIEDDNLIETKDDSAIRKSRLKRVAAMETTEEAAVKKSGKKRDAALETMEEPATKKSRLKRDDAIKLITKTMEQAAIKSKSLNRDAGIQAMENTVIEKSCLRQDTAIKSPFKHISRLESTRLTGQQNVRSKCTRRETKSTGTDALNDPDPLGTRHRPTAVVYNKNQYHLSRKIRRVEQNVLCTKPDVSRTMSDTTFQSERRSDPARSSLKTPSAEMKCKCKDTRDRRPCICKCMCKEEVTIYESTVEPVVSSSPSSRSVPVYSRESTQVQTSFPSLAPCNPSTCPKRRFIQCRVAGMQTEDVDTEWHRRPQSNDNVNQLPMTVCKIPPKRTAAMNDRLLRRIMYFDGRKSSVANKNVQFVTYDVKKMGFPRNQPERNACAECPGSRKCNLVLREHPFHLTCNEIVIEVKSLELNPEGVDRLKAVCSFLYIDYVFLGHLGNETNLAPLSNYVLFDSRKSFSISLRFNKKERSILREQVNPTGLLVKDTIMFLVVCQAAPELGVCKNRDFGFGYLSMKQISDQMGSEDKICANVEIQRIGGRNKIGRLTVVIEGMKAVRVIKDEKLNCVEPNVDAMMKRLQLNKKELNAVENEQVSSRRRKSTKI